MNQRLLSFCTFILFAVLNFTSLTLHARTEYVIALTEQSVRVASIEEIELGFNAQLASIEKNKNYGLKIKVFPSEVLFPNLLAEKKIYGYFGSPKFILEHKSEFNTDLLFTPVLGGTVMGRYVLLVRKDSGIDNLAKLKNTNISYCAVDEVGMLFLEMLLKDRKLGKTDTFFKKVGIKKNPNLNVSSVFFKEAQAALVLASDYAVAAELNPQIKQQLVAIETSPEYVTNLMAISSRLDGPMTGDELLGYITNMTNTMQSKKILRSYNFGEMRQIKFEDLNSVGDLINSLNESKGKPK